MLRVYSNLYTKKGTDLNRYLKLKLEILSRKDFVSNLQLNNDVFTRACLNMIDSLGNFKRTILGASTSENFVDLDFNG